MRNLINVNISVLITLHQFSENHHGGPQGGFQSLFKKKTGGDVWCQPSEFGCWRECCGKSVPNSRDKKSNQFTLKVQILLNHIPWGEREKEISVG